MAGENPSGFEIGGEVYEVPFLDSFDLDEAQILLDLSGVFLDDFKPPHPDAPQLEQLAVLRRQLEQSKLPSFRRALIHVAYRRKHPDYVFETLDEAIGKLNYLDIVVAIADARSDDEQDPSQSSPKQPDSESSESGTSDLSNGGKPSGSDLDVQDVTLATTGTGV